MSDADIVGAAIECLVTSDDGIVGDLSVSATVGCLVMSDTGIAGDVSVSAAV